MPNESIERTLAKNEHRVPENPANTVTCQCWRGHLGWLVRDSNPRRLSQLIYSQFPLAAWVTSHAEKSMKSDFGTLKGYQYSACAHYGLFALHLIAAWVN